MTKDEIKQKIIALENAIANEAYEITIGEQTVKYSNKDQLLKALNYFKSQLGALEESESECGRNRYAKQAISGRRFM